MSNIKEEAEKLHNPQDGKRSPINQLMHDAHGMATAMKAQKARARMSPRSRGKNKQKQQQHT